MLYLGNLYLVFTFFGYQPNSFIHFSIFIFFGEIFWKFYIKFSIILFFGEVGGVGSKAGTSIDNVRKNTRRGNRHYLTLRGSDYTELMAFKNWNEDGVDVYMRVNRWEVDVWSHFASDDQTDPATWHMAKTMKFISNHVWTIEDLYTRSNKRKQEAMETASTEEEPI